MERIAIIGSPGAGKSTFARRLSDITGIEVFHLDRLFWKPGWVETPKPEWVTLQQRLVRQEECPEKLDPEFLHYIWGFRKKEQANILQRLEAARLSGKQVIRLRTNRQAERYLCSLRQHLISEG